MENASQMYPVYDLLIQAALFSEIGISTKELMEVLEASYSTIKGRLDVVRSRSLLVTEKHGREHFYRIDIQEMDRLMLQGK